MRRLSLYGMWPRLRWRCASTSSMMTRPRAVSDWLMRQASLKCSPVAPDALFRSEPAFHTTALILELTGSFPGDLYLFSVLVHCTDTQTKQGLWVWQASSGALSRCTLVKIAPGS